MLKLHEYDETKKAIDFFINQYSKSTIKELNDIAKTFINWYDEIINAYSKNTYGVVLTNAVAESNNNYIQTLINIGYGYTNFKRLRKRILYMSSNKKGTRFDSDSYMLTPLVLTSFYFVRLHKTPSDFTEPIFLGNFL